MVLKQGCLVHWIFVKICLEITGNSYTAFKMLYQCFTCIQIYGLSCSFLFEELFFLAFWIFMYWDSLSFIEKFFLRCFVNIYVHWAVWTYAQCLLRNPFKVLWIFVYNLLSGCLYGAIGACQESYRCRYYTEHICLHVGKGRLLRSEHMTLTQSKDRSFMRRFLRMTSDSNLSTKRRNIQPLKWCNSTL